MGAHHDLIDLTEGPKRSVKGGFDLVAQRGLGGREPRGMALCYDETVNQRVDLMVIRKTASPKNKTTGPSDDQLS